MSEGTLDLTALAELQDLLEDEFPELIEAYLTDSRAGIVAIQTHLEQGDLEQLRRGAHSLKGSALNIGAPPLAKLWAALETNSGDQPANPTLLAQNIAEAIDQFVEVEHSLKTLLAGANSLQA